MRHATVVLLTSVLFSICGCAGFGVVSTSDPRAKLSDARHLYNNQGRPLIAERLIQEAIEIFQQKGDDVGLGEAYFDYAYFFLSPSIDKWEKVYREQGFRDKTATFDNRFSKADEYFAKSASSFEKARQTLADQTRFDTLANADRLRGFAYQRLKNSAKACAAFDDSLASYRKYMSSADKPQLNLPSGFTTYEDFVGSLKQKAGC
jgi:tetratricopeptide (TPR) repeat protein